MLNKKIIILSILLVGLLAIGAVSADDLQNYSGQVSGDVDVAAVNPWNTSG